MSALFALPALLLWTAAAVQDARRLEVDARLLWGLVAASALAGSALPIPSLLSPAVLDRAAAALLGYAAFALPHRLSRGRLAGDGDGLLGAAAGLTSGLLLLPVLLASASLLGLTLAAALALLRRRRLRGLPLPLALLLAPPAALILLWAAATPAPALAHEEGLLRWAVYDREWVETFTPTFLGTADRADLPFRILFRAAPIPGEELNRSLRNATLGYIANGRVTPCDNEHDGTDPAPCSFRIEPLKGNLPGAPDTVWAVRLTFRTSQREARNLAALHWFLFLDTLPFPSEVGERTCGTVRCTLGGFLATEFHLPPPRPADGFVRTEDPANGVLRVCFIPPVEATHAAARELGSRLRLLTPSGTALGVGNARPAGDGTGCFLADLHNPSDTGLSLRAELLPAPGDDTALLLTPAYPEEPEPLRALLDGLDLGRVWVPSSGIIALWSRQGGVNLLDKALEEKESLDNLLPVPRWIHEGDPFGERLEPKAQDEGRRGPDRTWEYFLILRYWVYRMGTALTALAGIIALTSLVVGGAAYALSGGDPEAAARARNLAAAGVVSAFLLAAAWTLYRLLALIPEDLLLLP